MPARPSPRARSRRGSRRCAPARRARKRSISSPSRSSSPSSCRLAQGVQRVLVEYVHSRSCLIASIAASSSISDASATVAPDRERGRHPVDAQGPAFAQTNAERQSAATPRGTPVLRRSSPGEQPQARARGCAAGGRGTRRAPTRRGAEARHVRRQGLHVDPVEPARAQADRSDAAAPASRRWRGDRTCSRRRTRRRRRRRTTPPTSASPAHASTLWAMPRSCSRTYAWITAGVIQVPCWPGRRVSAQPRMTSRKARSMREAQPAPPPRPAQAARHVQGREVEHAALGRAEPEQRQLLDRPRKDALPVGRQHRIGVQVAADGDDALRARRARIGELDDRHALRLCVDDERDIGGSASRHCARAARQLHPR